MPLHVIDVGSNEEENLKRWANALKGGGDKLDVFGIVYSGKRRRWTAREICQALGGRISQKRVTEVGKKLAGDTLLTQIDQYPVVYEKRDEVHHRKGRILSLARNSKKRDALPTKRNSKVAVTVRVHGAGRAFGKAIFITIDDIDQFAKVRSLKRNIPQFQPIPEKRFKAGLQKLFHDTGRYKDWGGELDDFFTNKLKIKGKRYRAAFALKGPGVRVKTMTPGKWGKHGNQIQRLVATPADVFVLQFEGTIDEYSIDQLKTLTEHKAQKENRKLYYAYIDRDDSARIRHAYRMAF